MTGWQQMAVWIWGLTLGAAVINAWVGRHYRTQAESTREELNAADRMAILNRGGSAVGVVPEVDR